MAAGPTFDIRDAVLELIKRNPGKTTSELAEISGISREKILRIGKTLQKHRLVRIESVYLGGHLKFSYHPEGEA